MTLLHNPKILCAPHLTFLLKFLQYTIIPSRSYSLLLYYSLMLGLILSMSLSPNVYFASSEPSRVLRQGLCDPAPTNAPFVGNLLDLLVSCGWTSTNLPGLIHLGNPFYKPSYFSLTLPR
jgi:hypothetical protein